LETQGYDVLLSNFVTELVINAILLWLLKRSLSKNLEDNKPQSQLIPLK
jgi:hypothetical protein